MKSIVLYQTKNGASEIYAKWLAEEKKAEIKTFSNTDKIDFDSHDVFYIISGTYGGQMPLVNFLKDNWEDIKQKDITAIAVGMVPANHWWSKISYKFIPKYIKANIKFYKLVGFVPDRPETKKALKKENLSIIK